MPIKKGKGGNRHKKAKNNTEDTTNTFLPKRLEGQTYAVVIKMLGNRRLLAKCEDEKERLCIIPGKFKGKRYWVSIGNLILLNIREYQDDKYDVIYIYNANDFKKLKREGELERLTTGKETENERGVIFYEDDFKTETVKLEEIDTDEEIDLETL
jgi:translation initiation factor 1A